MSSDTSSYRALSRWENLKLWLSSEATFFRIHLLAFTFIPLVASAIFYGCNGRFHIAYIDSIFLCYSAMTVTGLSTINLSTTTAWQQVILYLLMCIGDTTTVSWTMVLVRRSYFHRRCQNIVNTTRKFVRPRFQPPVTISSPIRSFRRSEPILDEKELTVNETKQAPATPEIDQILGSERDLCESPEPIASRASSHQQGPPRTLHFERRVPRTTLDDIPFPRRTNTVLTNMSRQHHDAKYRDHGGFPGPLELSNKLFQRVAPKVYTSIQRKMTLPYSRTLDRDSTSWLPFSNLTVGRNSEFCVLTDEQVEELGGVEYRVLNMLAWLIPLYFVGFQLLAFVLFAPWLSATKKYDFVFESQSRLVAKPWFSLFQVMGAYSGGGLTLADEGMEPFQNAWLMIAGLTIVSWAGNNTLPVILRLVIWIGHKTVSYGSRFHETTSFLLEHPRRCFLYLFPSLETWFLFICLVWFSVIEWVSFEVLDIGLPAYELLSPIRKAIDGLTARPWGFSTVQFEDLAPSLQFIHIVLMYVAIYPITVAIQATNVYEERSLGVFEEPPDPRDEAADLKNLERLGKGQSVGKYVAWHIRKQMAADIWWLIWGVLLVAIIERKNLMDQDKKWFDMFRVLFELTSAFGGIGLSLGFPDDNYSFSGTFRTLSKLVTIVLMIRGRHRGLPVAIDRAILLPSEFMSYRDRERDELPVGSSPNENGTQDNRNDKDE